MGTALISAALLTLASALLMPSGHDFDGHELQLAAQTFVFAFAFLLVGTTLIEVPAVLALHRLGATSILHYVVAGLLLGAALGLTAFFLGGGYSPVAPLHTWWRHSYAGAIVGVTTALVWSVLSRTLRSA